MVLLWIGIPLIIVSVAVAGYFYRHMKRTGKSEEASSTENDSAAEKEILDSGLTPPAGEKAYEGLLWLKGKYEEDIEKAEARFYEMRDEFRKLDKKYIDLRVHSIGLEQQLQMAQEGLPAENRPQSSANSETVPPTQVEQPDAGGSPAEVTELQEKLAAETQKVKDLEARLASSSQLLMKMYKELAGSLEANNTFYKNKAHENRVKGLVKEFDAVTAAGDTERKIHSWAESPSVDENKQFGQQD